MYNAVSGMAQPTCLLCVLLLVLAVCVAFTKEVGQHLEDDSTVSQDEPFSNKELTEDALLTFKRARREKTTAGKRIHSASETTIDLPGHIRRKRSLAWWWWRWKCPTGYVQYGGRCYLFKRYYYNFFSAQSACQREYGGNLVSINSRGENNYVNALVNSRRYSGYVWTGLWRPGYSWYWRFISGRRTYASYSCYYYRYYYRYAIYPRCTAARMYRVCYTRCWRRGWWFWRSWRCNSYCYWAYRFSYTNCYYSMPFVCETRMYPSYYFICKNGVGIHRSRKCDYRNDCGDWSDERGCTCPYPYSISYGYRSSSNNRIGATIYFYCYRGYRLYGSSRRTCLSSGTWSGSQPYCRLLRCGYLSSPRYGYVRYSGFNYGNRAYQRCYSGYKMYPSYAGTFRCYAYSGSSYAYWSGTYGSCQKQYCLYPGGLANGRLYVPWYCGYRYYYGCRVYFYCNSGYYRSGSSSIYCNAYGRWTSNVPVCLPIRPACSSPGTPSNGYISPAKSSYNYNEYVYFYCNNGYRRSGPSYRHCGSYGIWNNYVPSCRRVSCYNPGTPANGRRTSFTYYYIGGAITYACNNGFSLTGTSTITCQSTGQWSASKPTCNDINECSVNNGGCQQKCYNRLGSYICACNNGYTLYTANGTEGAYLPANQDGSSSNHDFVIKKSCVGKQCPELGLPGNGTHNATSVNPKRFGLIVKVSCNPGYEVDSYGYLKCLSDGKWDRNMPNCKLSSCGNPGTPSNGQRSGNDFLYGSQVSFSCNVGYNIRGSSVRDCQVSGNGVAWSGSQTSCEIIDCGELSTPIYGSKSTSITTYATTVSLSCRDGFNLTGSTERTCGTNELWNGTATTCLRKSCSDPGTPSRGLQHGSNYLFESSLTYSCTTPGYTVSHNNSLTCVLAGDSVGWNRDMPTCEDTQAPTYNQCPSDLTTKTDYGSNSANASFTSPVFTDNSGAAASVTVSPNGITSPYVFPVGTTTIGYKAVDTAGNENICTFNVIVTDGDPPNVQCTGSVTFSFGQAETLYIFEDKESSVSWTYDLEVSGEKHSGVIQVSDNVNISSVAIDISNGTILQYKQTRVIKVTAADGAGNTEDCDFTVTVSDAECPTMYSPVNGSLDCYDSWGSYTCDVLCDGGSSFSQNATTSYICLSDGDWFGVENLLSLEPVIDCSANDPQNCGIPNCCPDGSVKRDGYCLKCGTGSYFNNVSLICESCPRGTYQDEFAQTSCIDCPAGNSTAGIHSRNSSDCKGICPPGSYSSTGIALCTKCAKGSYQNASLQTSCYTCPNGTATLRTGSTSSDQCLDKCQPGEYSNTGGLAPCTLCPKGFYSTSVMSTKCEECSGMLTTPGPGATNASNCTGCPTDEFKNDNYTCYLYNKTAVTWDEAESICQSYGGHLASVSSDHEQQFLASLINATGEEPEKNNSAALGDQAVQDIPADDPCSSNIYTAWTDSTRNINYENRSLVQCDSAVNGWYRFMGNAGVKMSDSCVNTWVCGTHAPMWLSGGHPAVVGEIVVRKACAHWSNNCCNWQTNIEVKKCPSNYFVYKLNGTPTCSLKYCGVNEGEEPDPCNNYTTLTDSSRNIKNVDRARARVCDSNLNGWYRFMGNAGVKMSDSCVDTWSCGTHAPMWLSGGHPTVIGKVVVRTACAHWSDNCCHWSTNIEVKRCPSNYFVYKLNNAPACSLRYCGVDEGEEPENFVWLGGMNKNTSLISGWHWIDDGTSFQSNISFWSSSVSYEYGYLCMNKNSGQWNDCSKSSSRGFICEVKSEIDECKSFPCQQNGTCTDGNNNYTCECVPGYTGHSCEYEINECDSNPCQHSGTCEDHLARYSCQCADGYTGYSCETNINECKSEPCQNGGDCRDEVNSYTCLCRDGYTGVHCETDIDECSSGPCENGGSCYDMINSYNCTCVQGYTGSHCETNIDECASSPCVDGTCNDGINGYTCSCSPGYTGTHCESDVNECASYPCNNDGSCTDGINKYTCDCVDGYTGTHCETDIDECDSSPCKHSGTCTNRINKYECTCRTGYAGESCQTDIDECDSGPCLNGDCNDHVNGYSCTCNAGYTGVTCSEDIDECASNPCQNSQYSTCVDGINGYTCECAEGLSGSLCETNIDECASNPCKNSATCEDLLNAYTCNCSAGFTGLHCETDIDECISAPCENNGNCTDLVNAVQCTCSSGLTGLLCEVNIDDCKPDLCENGGTCVDEIDDFSCNCTNGYTGKNCSVEVNECDSNPCQNGGSCVDRLATYTCNCEEGFSGINCEINYDDCQHALPCLNGGSCVDGVRNTSCQCNKMFEGERCEKGRNTSFDLQFSGKGNDVAIYKDMPVNMTKFTICLWARFGTVGGNGTILVLRTVNESEDYNVITFNENYVRFNIRQQPKDINVTLSTGKWVSVCAVWNSSEGGWGVYRNGTVVDEGLNYVKDSTIKTKNEIYLGQLPLGGGEYDETERFEGEVSQVQVWGIQLNSTTIKKLTTNCSAKIYADIAVWPDFSAGIEGDVQLNKQKCGTASCKPGLTGTYCNIPIDKTDPELVKCPEDKKVVSTSRSSKPRWEAPVFKDDYGIRRTNSSHKNGETTLTWGEYEITYTAEDWAGNTAKCSFTLYVIPVDCEILDPPAHGIKVCGNFEVGIYCLLDCKKNYALGRSEKMWSCDTEGWKKPNSEETIEAFPACRANKLAELAEASGSVSYKVSSTTNCDQTWKDKVIKAFQSSIIRANDAQGGKICKRCSSYALRISRLKYQCQAAKREFVPEPCIFKNLDVKCDANRRKRRSTGNDTIALQIDFVMDITENGTLNDTDDSSIDNSFSFSSGNTTLPNDEDSDSPIEALENVFESGELSLEIDNETLEVDPDIPPTVKLSSNCSEGEIGSGIYCIPCDRGTYYVGGNSSNSSEPECVSCDVGFYQDQEGQTSCIPCPVGKTTSNTGSVNSTACREEAPVGHYYSSIQGAVLPCPKGQYQNNVASFNCIPCPDGVTTEFAGSINETDCNYACGLGTQLSVDEQCVNCSIGTYRADESVPYCLPCSEEQTTQEEGSTKESDCIWNCQPGEYIDDGCLPCDLGSYQPQKWQNKCLPCNNGYTTDTKGANSSQDCRDINECEEVDIGGNALNDCGEDKCINTDGSFTCEKLSTETDSQVLIIAVSSSVGGSVVLILIVVVVVVCKCKKNKAESSKDCVVDFKLSAPPHGASSPSELPGRSEHVISNPTYEGHSNVHLHVSRSSLQSFDTESTSCTPADFRHNKVSPSPTPTPSE